MDDHAVGSPFSPLVKQYREKWGPIEEAERREEAERDARAKAKRASEEIMAASAKSAATEVSERKLHIVYSGGRSRETFFVPA